jgi:hypothetical protein
MAILPKDLLAARVAEMKGRPQAQGTGLAISNVGDAKHSRCRCRIDYTVTNHHLATFQAVAIIPAPATTQLYYLGVADRSGWLQALHSGCGSPPRLNRQKLDLMRRPDVQPICDTSQTTLTLPKG